MESAFLLVTDADPTSSVATGVVLLFLCIIIYFLPAAAAWNKRNFGAVFALNFFLGWTIIGWIVAMCWGLMNDAPTQQVIIQPPIMPPLATFCSGCGKYSPVGAQFCSVCGHSFSAPSPASPARIPSTD